MSPAASLERLKELANALLIEDATSASGYFSQADALLRSLREESESMSGGAYIRVVLTGLRVHFKSLADMCGQKDQAREQHLRWILGDVSRLESPMGFDRKPRNG